MGTSLDGGPGVLTKDDIASLLPCRNWVIIEIRLRPQPGVPEVQIHSARSPSPIFAGLSIEPLKIVALVRLLRAQLNRGSESDA